MPSHLSGDPEVEANEELLCPRNLIRGSRMDMASQNALSRQCGSGPLEWVFPGNESTEAGIRIGQGIKKETPKANET